MSKKTQNIYNSINAISEIQKKLESYTENKEIQNISFELDQQLKTLKFWIDSLYLYNGKSTSNAKKKSSRENGKKGGRPPKEVTIRRRRILELETQIQDLKSKLANTLDFEEEQKINNSITQMQQELDELNKTNSI